MKRLSTLRLPFLVFLFGLIAATSAYGGSSYGTVTTLYVVPSGGPNVAGVAFIYLSSPNSAPPSCDTADVKRFVVDLNTPGGQATYSMAMTARVSGQPVAITGTGNCAVWGDTETVSIIGY